MMSDQQLYIVLIAFACIMILQYYAFYSRGVKMKIPFFVLTVLMFIGLLMPSVDSVFYSVQSLILFVWMGMVILGLYKFMTYRASFAKKLQLAYKAPTSEYVSKLTKHIDNRRITFQWVLSKSEKYVDAITSIYNSCTKSSSIDTEIKTKFEEVLIKNGFEYVIKGNHISDYTVE